MGLPMSTGGGNPVGAGLGGPPPGPPGPAVTMSATGAVYSQEQVRPARRTLLIRMGQSNALRWRRLFPQACLQSLSVAMSRLLANEKLCDVRGNTHPSQPPTKHSHIQCRAEFEARRRHGNARR
jgi:hypothetical protein